MENYDIKNVRRFLQMGGMEDVKDLYKNLFGILFAAGTFLIICLPQFRMIVPVISVLVILLIMLIWALRIPENKMERQKYIFLYSGVTASLIALFFLLDMLLFVYSYDFERHSVVFLIVLIGFFLVAALLAKLYGDSILRGRKKRKSVENSNIAFLVKTIPAIGVTVGYVLVKSLSQTVINALFIFTMGMLGLLFGALGMLCFYRHIIAKKYNMI